MSAERNVSLFSYGTLRDEMVQLALFGRRLTATPDDLAGFGQGEIELVENGETGRYPIIAASDDLTDRVAGQVLELSPAELATADIYEGDDYARIQVRLVSGRPAWVYARP